jgi:hypothetical protein
VDTSNGYHLLQVVDGGPLGGNAGGFGSVHHRVLKMTSMTAPLGVLPVGPTTSTTEFEDDVDGSPLRTLPVGLATSTTEVVDDVDGDPLGGATSRSGCIHHRVLRRHRWRAP